MSTTVSTGNVTMTSTSATAEELVKTLSDEKEEKPKVLVDKGVSVEEEPEKEGLSKAASEMGKEGAKAAARARKLAEKDARKDGATKRDPDDKRFKPFKGSGEVDDEPEEIDEAEEAGKHASAEIESEPDREKRKQLASERVREATQKAAAERRRADKLESELQALRNAPRAAPGAQPEARRTEEAPKQAEGKERPQEGDFEHYSEYVEALTDWKTDQKFAEARKVQEREQFAHSYANEQVRAIDTFRNKVKEAILADESLQESVIPFKEVVQNSSHGVPPGGAHTAFNVVNDEILRSDVPAQLMAYLNGNEDVMRELLSLPNRDAIARKMERIQASLEDAPTGTPSPARAVSKAPPPFQPVKGTPRTATGDLTDKSPLSDFVRSHGESLMRTRAR